MAHPLTSWLTASVVLLASPMTAADDTTALPAPPERVFWSGHSLTDRPIPDDLAAIAKSLGHPIAWERQYILGSSIKKRTAGEANDGSGYRNGINAAGHPFDALAELARPKSVDGPYDTFIVTEQHSLLETLMWNDPVRHLKGFHDRYIERNPNGNTWFYQSWLGIDDKADPRRWVAYERSAAPVWECLVTRINTELAAQGRKDRLRFLPVGDAFADLVERATQSSALPALRMASTRETMDLLFSDNVHTTRIGAYYAALSTYALLLRASPVGAWAPPEVNPRQAAELQNTAWGHAQRWHTSHQTLTLPECREVVRGSFGSEYWSFARASYTPPNETLRDHVKRYQLRARSWWQMWRDNAENPFWFDPNAAPGKAATP